MIIIVIGFSVLSGINEFSTHTQKNLWEGEGIGGGGKEGDFFVVVVAVLSCFFLFNKNFPSMNMSKFSQ